MNKTPSLVIDGRKLAGDRGTLPVIDPALGEAFAKCPNASPAQLDEAVAAAGRAFEQWQHSTCAERRALLEAIAARIEQNAPELAEIIVREQGKPLALAHMEVGGAVAWTRATAALELPIEVIEDRPGKRIELHRRPLGVVGSITPWNWPLMIAVWHIMPALRAGNAVVIKPSELTPLNTLRLVELIDEVAPLGLVNAVAGGGALGREISGHPGIHKIVFTGSTRTGQDIMRNAADTLKRLTLELGGNDAGIVLPGTDIGAIAEGVFGSAFLNMDRPAPRSSACMCTSRSTRTCAATWWPSPRGRRWATASTRARASDRSRTATSSSACASSSRTRAPQAPASCAAANPSPGRATSTRRPSSPTSPTAPGWWTRSSSARCCR